MFGDLLKFYLYRNLVCVNIDDLTHVVSDIEILENKEYINLIIKRKRINYLGKCIIVKYSTEDFAYQLKKINNVHISKWS